MRDLYNLQIGFRAAIYCFYRYSTPAGALNSSPSLSYLVRYSIRRRSLCFYPFPPSLRASIYDIQMILNLRWWTLQHLSKSLTTMPYFSTSHPCGCHIWQTPCPLPYIHFIDPLPLLPHPFLSPMLPTKECTALPPSQMQWRQHAEVRFWAPLWQLL